ncbi:MAG: hypothetical protein LBL27_02705 [Coriobacteriales bacterium]|jgi:hypothetical protein|nr:hypothetical protein [Coriobacteriales bacterium]
MDTLRHRVALAKVLCAVSLALLLVCPQLALASTDASIQAAERLRTIAGTTESVTFWSGGTAERPEYTWTFMGQELPKEQAAALTSLDLEIALTADDANGDGAFDTLMLDFAHEGLLPAPALISVIMPDGLDGKGGLTLFTFDERTASFTENQRGLVAADGYVSFHLTHCSRWALSTVDLTLPASQRLGDTAAPEAAAVTPTEATPTASAPQAAASQQTFPFGLPVPALIAIPALAVSALVVILVIRHRRRVELAAMQQGWNTSELVFEDIPSIDELVDIEEPVE